MAETETLNLIQKLAKIRAILKKLYGSEKRGRYLGLRAFSELHID